MSESKSVQFIVEGQPIPKARPRLSRGKVYTPKKTKDWEKLVAQTAMIVMSGRDQLTGHLRVTLTFYRATQVHCDIDNLQKSILDALNDVVWGDDSQITSLQSYMRLGSKIPHVMVVVQPDTY
jgi:crossover junction endodeoxyribonuclease RusA